MKKNLVPIFGLVGGFGLVVFSISLNGNIRNFVEPGSLMITVLGSFCALLISFPLKVLLKIPGIVKMLVREPEDDRKSLITFFSDMARKARKEGLLALEDEMLEVDDEFIASGIQMIVDGIEPEVIRNILELKIETTERRHREGQEVFKKWGELAPAFGMLGTLMGLIVMLAKLDDPNAIGSGMAVALITTFYGSLMANMVFLPIANNLSIQTEEEMFTKEMVLEGILEIQAGTNPRILEEKLMTYLSPEENLKIKEEREIPPKEAGIYE